MASRDRRPAEIGNHRIADYTQWADERLVADPDAALDYWEARNDYLMWASDRIAKPQPISKQRATLKAAGATIKGRGNDLRYHGVRLAGPPDDSGYRAGVGYTAHPDEAVLHALRNIQQAGLVTDRKALNSAYTHLTGGPQ